MSITKNSGRQYPLVEKVAIGHADLTSGSAVEAIDLPPNATVIGGEFVVETVWDSATSDVADIGDGVDDDRYTSSQIDLQSAGRTALTLTGYKYTGKDTIDITWTGVGGSLTQGSAYLLIQYVIDDRANENQPA